MRKLSLDALARERLENASTAASGRSAATVYGGHEHALRQTVLALTARTSLAEHEKPGEATPLMLRGRVRLTSGDNSSEGRSGDLITVPTAPPQSAGGRGRAVLLTVAKQG
ncbi:LuxR family transcriptional regulator [Streptomyces flaveolus]